MAWQLPKTWSGRVKIIVHRYLGKGLYSHILVIKALYDPENLSAHYVPANFLMIIL